MKITQVLESTKTPVTKPRNFVAKNAMKTTSGAGQHKDKKRAEKQGDVKHKKQAVPIDENTVVENETGYYYERLAQELFNMNPNLDTSGRADELLNAAFPLIVRDLGSKKRANSLLNYDEDFPSDFVSAYADLKRENSMAENYPKHQDLSGISTDKLKAYLAKQSQQQGSGEGNQVKRVRAELQRREQGVAEGSAHGYNVARYYEKYNDQKKITNWLRTNAGLDKTAPVYFDDADLVYGDQTIVPDALVNPKYKMSDLLAAVVQAADGGNVAEGEEGFSIEDNGEYNDEAGMSESNLHTLARAVQGLIDTIDEDENLPEWCQEKIAKAEMMLVSVWDYLLSQEEQGIDPRV